MPNTMTLMGYCHRLASLFLVAGILVAAPAAASAQCRLCSTPTTEQQETGGGDEIKLEVQSTLDFDRLVVVGGGGGVATLLANGDRSSAGSIATISAGAMVGSVVIHGQPGRIVRVEMPRRIELHSVGGASISIDGIGTDLPSLPRLDSEGSLSFRFGGHLQISGDADGQYRGDVPITVEYL